MLTINAKNLDLKSQAKQGMNLNIHKLNYMLNEISNRKLKKSGINLTNSQYLVLKCIFLLDSPLQKDIAEYLKISSPAVSRHCYLLRKKGFIKVKDMSKREHIISFTQEGKQIFVKSLKLLNKEVMNHINNYDSLSKLIYTTVTKIDLDS